MESDLLRCMGRGREATGTSWDIGNSSQILGKKIHHAGSQILGEKPERLWDLHQTSTGQGLEQLGPDLVQQSWPCFGQRVSPFLSKLFHVSVRAHLNDALTLFPGTLSPLHKAFILLYVAFQLLYVSRPSFLWRNQGFPYFPHLGSHPQWDISGSS